MSNVSIYGNGLSSSEPRMPQLFVIAVLAQDPRCHKERGNSGNKRFLLYDKEARLNHHRCDQLLLKGVVSPATSRCCRRTMARWLLPACRRRAALGRRGPCWSVGCGLCTPEAPAQEAISCKGDPEEAGVACAAGFPRRARHEPPSQHQHGRR